MKKILLSLLLAGGVKYSFAMQGSFGGSAAQGGAAQSDLSELNKQLIEAAKQGNAEVVRALLAGCADVNAKDAKGITALIFAAYNGYAEVVRALLDNGADVNIQTENAGTGLIAAVYNGHVEIVRALLDNGANVDVRDENGNTALTLATNDGQVESVKVLLASGANVNAQSKQGETALMLATKNRNTTVVKYLLALGANADVNLQDMYGNTALIIAARNQHFRIVRALLESGADVNLQDKYGKKAIYYTDIREIMALLNGQAGKISSAPKISSSQPAPSSASASRAASGSTDLASAGGGVARAGGGAGQNISKTLCTTVAAKILAEAGTQTEPIQVEPSQAAAQKRFLSSGLKSAFSKPSLPEKPSSTSEMDCDEATASGCIVKPIARRLKIAPHVAAPQVFSLKPLILEARANGTGLFGLIQLLHDSAANVYFYASEVLRLVERLGFDTSVFAGVGYQPITGLDLAMLLNNSISSRLGAVDDAVGFTAEQTQQFQSLETLFQKLP